ncbi:MAG TPA: tetratricopeptide repeat protein [Roseiflexaceae bacterium]|nr:tetratricopeptide repeat protein [Roseiflexaceae bacterium]
MGEPPENSDSTAAQGASDQRKGAFFGGGTFREKVIGYQENHEHKIITILAQMPRPVLAIVVLALLMIAGATVISAADAWPGVRSGLEQAGILNPELEVASEAAGETLILVLPFEVSSGVADTKIHREIARAIEEQRAQLALEQVRVVALREGGLPANDQDAAKVIGQRYKATMIVWGSDTGSRVEVSFLHLKEPTFDAADVTISEIERSQIANGPAYVTFVTKELPRQLSFLALFALGQSAYSQGAYQPATQIIEQAVKQLEGMRELSEGSAAAYFRLGWLYQEPGDDLRQAEAAYTEVIRLQPEDAAAYYNRGNARSEQGDKAGAIADYTKAIRLQPSFAEPYLNRGAVRSEQGDKAGAIADYTEAIRFKPDYAVAYFNRGAIRSEQGDKAGAIADYTEAIHLQSSFALPYYSRGLARSTQGDQAGAIADFTQAIRLQPNNTAAFYNRGNARSEQGDKAGAIADYTEAIRIQPSFAEPYLNRGVLRSEQGDKAGAIADYTEAIRIQPSFAEPYLNRGAVRSEQGDKAGAIADYTEAIRIQPDYANAYYNRGNARSAQGDKTGAIADYRRALELYPLDSPVYEATVAKLRELGITDPHAYPYPPPSTP